MAQIIDTNGNPIQSEILREPQTARLSSLRREYANHPSRGLTPFKLARILEEAELGHLQAQADLFADMEEKDAHLFAEMAKRKNAILSVDWKIEPPRNADANEKANADYLTEILTDLPGFEDFMLGLMDAVGYGYSNVEIEWQLAESQWLPKALTPRPASWFMINYDDQNDIRLRDYSAGGAVLQPFGWVRHVHKAKSGYIARCGIHRVLAWPYLFKNYAIRDLAELLEVYGIPMRLGTYPSGVGADEKATLLRAVTELGHSAAGIIPEGMKIEFPTITQGTNNPHQAMVDWAEKSISKAILGATLTSQADGKSSTNALGKVHNEVRHDLLASDARQVAATVTRDLLYPLLALNRGVIAAAWRIPRLVFDVRELADFGAYSTALPALVNIGTPVPVSWVQKKLGIPVPVGDEPLLVQMSKAPTATPPPEPVPGLSGLMTQLVALSQAHSYPDQTAIDSAVDALPAATLQAQSAQMLGDLGTRLASATSDTEALGMLAEAFPEMDPAALADGLGYRLFVARLVGMLSAQQEAGGRG
jgi:phage gp29-like protein